MKLSVAPRNGHIILLPEIILQNIPVIVVVLVVVVVLLPEIFLQDDCDCRRRRRRRRISTQNNRNHGKKRGSCLQVRKEETVAGNTSASKKSGFCRKFRDGFCDFVCEKYLRTSFPSSVQLRRMT